MTSIRNWTLSKNNRCGLSLRQRMTNSEKLFSEINQSENILIICHRNPDADTIGSAGALAFYISEEYRKAVTLFCVNEPPKSLDFLGLNKFFIKTIAPDLSGFDLVIAVDCGDISQTGLAEKFLQFSEHEVPTANIDHHQTNGGYADTNIVESSSATADIIYRLLKERGARFTKQISTCLLAGIISDTTYFTNAGTTKEAMAHASELLKNQADIKAIIKNTWRKNSPEALKVWGKILSQLQFNEKYKIVTAVISREDAIMPEVFEGLANFLTTLYEANIILVLREEADGEIKCSLRTTKDNIDVSKLAKKFGGGGHAGAAGFSLRGRLMRTEKGWVVEKI